MTFTILDVVLFLFFYVLMQWNATFDRQINFQRPQARLSGVFSKTYDKRYLNLIDPFTSLFIAGRAHGKTIWSAWLRLIRRYRSRDDIETAQVLFWLEQIYAACRKSASSMFNFSAWPKRFSVIETHVLRVIQTSGRIA